MEFKSIKNINIKQYLNNPIAIYISILFILMVGFYSFKQLNYINQYNYKIGDVVKENIEAKVPFEWIDKKKSQKKVEEKIKDAPDIYILEDTLYESKKTYLLEDIKRVNNVLSNSNIDSDEKIQRITTIWRNFTNIKELNLKDSISELSETEMNTIAQIAVEILKKIYKIGIINQSFLIENSNKNILIKRESDDKKIDAKKMILEENLDERLKNLIGNYLEGESKYKILIFYILKNYISTNLKYSEKLTEQYKDTIREKQTYVTKNINKNEIIARKGQIIDQSIYNKLNKMVSELVKIKILNIIGFIAFLLIIFIILYNFIKKYFKFDDTSKYKIFLLVTILYFLIIVLFSNFKNIELFFILPFFTFIMANYFLIGFNFSILSILIYLNIYFFYSSDSKFLIFYLLISLYFLINKQKLKKRNPKLKTILYFIAFTFISIIVINTLFYGSNTTNTGNMFSVFTWFLYSVINISLSLVTAYVLIYLFERYYNITTDINLTELLNWDNPLLKKLMNVASGTYRHSVIVSEISEEAANEIEADSILAKVGGLYHDIGKIKRSNYFIENQLLGPNKHDSLLPIMSVRIIKNHVDEGVKIAQKYGLANKLADIIKEHHGTSLIKFFYRKAKKESKEEIDEKFFRYNGPKPTSKESAIIFLADKVEAVARVLIDSPFHHLKERIDKIFKESIEDGQLDNSNLTLKELDKIKLSFIEYFKSNLHKRIEYPEEIK